MTTGEYQTRSRMGRCARGTDEGKLGGKEQRCRREVAQADGLEGRRGRTTNIQRAGRMVLHPLTEVGIGMLMAVRVGGSQLMMYILRCGKRRQGEKKDDKA